eukprot:4808428-Amphidinium_carterae.3
MIVGDTSQQEANIPKTYKSPTLPSQQEIDEHYLAHLPYRDWCKHYVQGKSKSQHHPCGGLTKQSITQVDYAFFLKSDNDNHNAIVLTMCESINNGTWLRNSSTVQGSNAEALNTVHC